MRPGGLGRTVRPGGAPHAGAGTFLAPAPAFGASVYFISTSVRVNRPCGVTSRA